jgi:hypothetical protein
VHTAPLTFCAHSALKLLVAVEQLEPKRSAYSHHSQGDPDMLATRQKHNCVQQEGSKHMSVGCSGTHQRKQSPPVVVELLHACMPPSGPPPPLTWRTFISSTSCPLYPWVRDPSGSGTQ